MKLGKVVLFWHNTMNKIKVPLVGIKDPLISNRHGKFGGKESLLYSRGWLLGEREDSYRKTHSPDPSVGENF